MMRAKARTTGDWGAYRFQFEPDEPNGIVSWTMNVEGSGNVQT